MREFRDQIEDILVRVDEYHANYYKKDIFGGPCLYFHRRALETGGGSDITRHLEYVYTVVTSWGMHRMGRRGSKMYHFEVFLSSISPLLDTVAVLRQRDIRDLSYEDWSRLEELFKHIEIMKTGAHLVGHSKVLAHLLPQLVCPIDRTYTLMFLYGNRAHRNNINEEWEIFREIHVNFILPIVFSENFQERAVHWIQSQERYCWDTSFPKIVDNLVIGRIP